MNKFIISFIAIILLSTPFIVNATTTPGTILDSLVPSRKNCNYVTNKLYEPFSDINEDFPGIKDLMQKGKNEVNCIKIDGGTENLLRLVFSIGISIIIILTIINIAVSGIQYMTEQATGQIKGGAKKRLKDSVIALGLGLLSYTILYTVNKQLVNFTFNPVSIDINKSIDKGINSANNATGSFSSDLGGIEFVGQPTTPGSPTPYPNPNTGILGEYNNFGSWNESITENWVKGLPSGVRSTDGRLVVTVYSATKDEITDTNTSQKRGNRNNLLREGSVALSPDLISKYKPMTGQEIFINGTSIGFYEDATAASYNGVTFNNTVDIYDENGTLGGSYLKNIPAGQWTIYFGSTKRPQISNP